MEGKFAVKRLAPEGWPHDFYTSDNLTKSVMYGLYTNPALTGVIGITSEVEIAVEK